MLPKLAKALVVAALIVSLGAHWAFLQSVAWAGMLYTYSQQAGFAEAVSMTFDGDHPCALCQKIQTGKNAERQEKQEDVQPSKELKLNLPPLKFVLAHPPQPKLFWVMGPALGTTARGPELPPPRMA